MKLFQNVDNLPLTLKKTFECNGQMKCSFAVDGVRGRCHRRQEEEVERRYRTAHAVKDRLLRVLVHSHLHLASLCLAIPYHSFQGEVVTD